MEVLLAYQKEVLANLKKAEKNYKKTPKDRIKKPYLETRLDNLEQLWTVFKDGHKSIIGKATATDKLDTYFTEDMYEEFEEVYVSYKTLLKEALQPYLVSTKSTSSVVQKSSDGHVVSECEVKLPRIKLPTFSGKYGEWQTFYDMFYSLIHTNEKLAPVQKLQYLKNNLSGEPACLLSVYSTTDANYDDAWNQLLKRYDNKRYNSNEVVKIFYAQKQIVSESASAIKLLLDTTTTCLKSLRNMGINTDNSDVFIVYYVVSKLDPESIKQWEFELGKNNDTIPSWAQLCNFLESRYRALEMIDTNKVRTPVKANNSKQKSFHGFVNNSKNNNYMTTIKCIICQGEHLLFQCKEFSKLNVKDRQDYVQKNKLCFNCFSPSHPVMKCRSSSSCRRCGRRHHSLLHLERELSTTTTGEDSPTKSESIKTVSTPISTNFSSKGLQPSRVLLATVSVWAYNKHGYKQQLRGLLDQGSQASFVSESVVQLLGLTRKLVSGTVSGIGNGGHTTIKHMVSLQIESRHNPEVSFQVNAYVLRSVTTFLPTTELHTPDWLYLDKIPLADPGYATPGKIDILLGAEVYSEILLDGIIRHNKLLAQNTTLGWVLSGRVSRDSNSANERVINMHLQLSGDELLKKFWEMENEPNCIQKKMTKIEERCEEYYNKTTMRDEEGRFIVKLPFDKEDPECQYGKSVVIATRRWEFLEKRLQRDSTLKEEYNKVLEEYLTMNHMIPIKEENIDKPTAVYLPHHAVVRKDKDTTKVRVVFDGSCKGVNNFSLNDNLLVGPKLQQDLRHILMRWRMHRICIVADIVKMYRMVKVADEDTDYQRIVWRPQIDEPLKHFKLLRLTFGTACAPYLAVKTIQKLADEEHSRFPVAADITKTDFYVDDLMTGTESLREAIHIYNDMNKMMSCGGFELQKWSSNNHDLMTHIGTDRHRNNDSLRIKTSTVMKVLGLVWNREVDAFQYTFDTPDSKGPITKRQVLSEVSRLYDPLGWIAPIVIIAKIFMQKLWKSKIDWDDVLPTELWDEWLHFQTSLVHLRNINIPRWFSFSPGSKVELHAFADASRLAYGAAVYIRTISKDGKISVSLVTAKSKVAPIEKEVSIPRLELCGAVLAAKLIFEVSQVLNVSKKNLYAWSDSTIVLAWIRGGSSRWTTFVSNRVSEILNILEYEQWGHVVTNMNPADCVSRGLSPQDLYEHVLWWSGPSYLLQPVIEFDKFAAMQDTHEEERHASLTALPELKSEFIWTMFSSLTKTLKAVSYWRRVLHNLRLPKQDRKLYSKLVTPTEMKQSLEICIKQVQEEHFGEEIKQLKMQKFVSKKSKLHTLCPIFNENGVLRVGGRIDLSKVGYDTKHPIIMPAKSHLTKLIISDAHFKTFHGGPQAMLCYLRAKYWILRAKDQVKSHYRACVKCLRYSKTRSNQLMGQIPEVRLKPTRPFKSSGCDYMGPINVRLSPGRGTKSYKGYICLFVCMVTRAIHLEVVTDLTSKAFIAAFKRFTARRGHCEDLFSDNGTNFVGANKQLREMFDRAKSTVANEIEELLSLEHTTWHFIPPYAPNFGGLWEAGVRSVKTHLHKVVGDTTLTYEELSTVLAQVEACLNSRPITVMSDDPNEPQALTPGHFLIGEPLINIPDEDYSNSNIVGLDRWRLTQKIVNNFWKRWYKEYLVNLNQRYKWNTKKSEPEVGDVIILKEDNIPPAKWILGRVIRKYTGPDNITRVVSIKCKNGELKRPISKICMLPK